MGFLAVLGGFSHPSAFLALKLQKGNKTGKRGKQCFQEKEKHLPLGSGALRRRVMMKMFVRCLCLVMRSYKSQIQSRL